MKLGRQKVLLNPYVLLLFGQTYPEVDEGRPVKWEKKEVTQSYDKNPYIHRKLQKATWQHKERHQKLGLHKDYGPT